MRKLPKAIAGAALFVLSTGSATEAQNGAGSAPGDKVRGLMLARAVCSNCHVVSVEAGGLAIIGVPSFAAIAAKAGQTPDRLAASIIIPHPPMPSVQLTNTEMRDIIAYIGSLAP